MWTRRLGVWVRSREHGVARVVGEGTPEDALELAAQAPPSDEPGEGSFERPVHPCAEPAGVLAGDERA